MKVAIITFLLGSHIAFTQGNIDLKNVEDIYERGKDLYYEGEYDEAIKTLDSATVLLDTKIKDPVKLHVRTEQRLGSAHRRAKNYERAQEHLIKAVEYAKEVYGAESDRMAGLLSDLGLVNSDLGRYTKAMSYFDQAIAMQIRLDGKESEGSALISMNKGILFFELGQYSKSASTLLYVLEIYDDVLESNDQNYNRVYLTLSNIYRKSGDVANAVVYAEKALEIKLINYPESHPSVTKYLMNVGKALVEVGRSKDAEVYFKRAEKNVRARKDKKRLGNFINDSARTYLQNGEFEKALESFKRARSLMQDIDGDTYNTNYNIAVTLDLLGRQEEAFRLLKSIAIDRPDAQNQLRLSKWARRLGYQDEAKHFASNGKTFLGEGNELQEIDYLVNDSKLSVEEDLELAWSLANNAIERLTKMRRTYSGNTSKSFINNELEGIFHHVIQLGLLRHATAPKSAKIFEDLYLKVEQAKAASFWDNQSEDNASYYGGVPGEVLEELQILQDSGPEKTVELSRYLEDLEGLYPKYFKYKYSLDFPSLEEVQASLSSEMLIMDYFVLDREVVNLMISKDDFKVLKYPREEDFSFSVEASEILSSITRVIVIPHGFVHRIAFDQILHPGKESLLVYEYAFSYQVNVRGLVDERPVAISENYLGMVPSWDGIGENASTSRSELVPLPGALREVEDVSSLFRGKVLSNKEATESNFTTLASGYDIIHLATHATVDPENELNSILYLNGDPALNADGRLEMDEIMEIELSSDLVILSACETGAGGFKTGEGVMSLARAFQYAGARSVLMSLWRTNDQAAHPIVLNFVKNYKAGMTKDVALQQSKIAFLSEADPLLRDPYYWAGFMVSGDLSAVESGAWKYRLILVLGAIIIIFLIYRFS